MELCLQHVLAGWWSGRYVLYFKKGKFCVMRKERWMTNRHSLSCTLVMGISYLHGREVGKVQLACSPSCFRRMYEAFYRNRFRDLKYADDIILLSPTILHWLRYIDLKCWGLDPYLAWQVFPYVFNGKKPQLHPSIFRFHHGSIRNICICPFKVPRSSHWS